MRLPALIGASRAMDMILTGRAVGAKEALQMGSCTTKGKLRMRIKPYRSLLLAYTLELLACFLSSCKQVTITSHRFGNVIKHHKNYVM